MSRTILVRNLPPDFHDTEKCALLRDEGAIDVRCMSAKGSLKNSAFASFTTHDAAVQAVAQLHRRELRGYLLRVEIARETEEVSTPPLFSPLPPPTFDILQNITNTMLAVPEFYAEVLAIMRERNLPCPFPGDGPFCSPPMVPPPSFVSTMLGADGDVEQELVSDAMAGPPCVYPIPNYLREQKQKKVFSVRPNVRRISPCPGTKNRRVTTPAAVFDDAARMRKRLTIKTVGRADHSSSNCPAPVGEFGKFSPPQLPPIVEGGNEQLTSKDTLSLATIRLGRLPVAEREHLRVFRGYTAGAPCRRLYVKNVAKRVTLENLMRVFGAFLDRSDAEWAAFDVRLLTGGRMRGQAFVTFGDVEKARRAREETNGFVMEGKPIVVAFARSAQGEVDGAVA